MSKKSIYKKIITENAFVQAPKESTDVIANLIPRGGAPLIYTWSTGVIDTTSAYSDTIFHLLAGTFWVIVSPPPPVRSPASQ